MRSTVGHRGDAQAVLHQVLAQQAADLGVVVDDQDVVGRVHGANFRMVPGGPGGRKVTQCVSRRMGYRAIPKGPAVTCCAYTKVLKS